MRAGPSQILAWVTAIVAPVLVAGAGVAWLGRQDAAGAVSADVAAMDAALASAPDVVFLGNSKITTDIDYDAVATALGVPRAKIVSLSVPGSNAAMWYAVLRERVVRAGVHPSRIVVYSPMQFLVATALTDQTQRTRLHDQMPDPDAVVTKKVLGSTDGPFMTRLQRRRAEVHTSFTDGVRDLAVGGLASLRGGAPGASSGDATAALHAVFGEAGVDRPGAVGPIVEAKDTVATSRGTSPTSLDQTLIPDLLDLADEAHARLLFVLAPYGYGDLQDPALEAEAIAAVAAHHAGWLDLREEGPPPSSLPDLIHMSPAGRRTFAPILSAALVEVGLRGDTFAPPRPRRLAFVRTGTPPALVTPTPTRGTGPCDWTLVVPALGAFGDHRLMAAGLGMVSPLTVTQGARALTPHASGPDPFAACTGTFRHNGNDVTLVPFDDPEAGATVTLGLAEDVPLRSAGAEAYWVYPGTTLRAEVTFPPGTSLYLRAKVYGGTGATVDLGDEHAVLGPSGEIPNLPGSGTQTLSVHSDNSYVILTHVAVGDPAHADHYVGSGKPVRTRAMREVAFAAPPPSLPALPAPVAGAKPGIYTVGGGVKDLPSSKELQAALGSSCLPIVLTAGGVRSDALNVDKRAFASISGDANSLVVTTQPDLVMGAPGETYTYGLSDARQCVANQYWLYPYDDLRSAVAARDLVITGADELELTGAVFGPPESVLHVLVTSTAGTHLDRDVTGAALASGGVVLPLDVPVPAGSAGVTIHVTNPGAPYAALSGMWLTQSPPVFFPASGGALRGGSPAP